MVDPYAANRQLERILGFNSDERSGVVRDDPYMTSDQEELLVTIVYNLGKGTVEYQYPDGRRILKRA